MSFDFDVFIEVQVAFHKAIYQCLLTQILEIPLEFDTLVDENLCWNTKLAKHSIQKCI
jgi:hypothetical protein